MKKNVRIISLICIALAAALLLSACAGTLVIKTSDSVNGGTTTSVTPVGKTGETTVTVLDDPSDDDKETTDDFAITALDGAAEPTKSGSTYTITCPGEYELTGKLSDGQIIVNAGDSDEVKLILNNCSISCSYGAPILAENADKVIVNAEKGSYNVITDARTGDPDAASESDDNIDAAIYAKCDLNISGTGTIIVSANYDNGIKTKDDLSIKKVTLKVEAYGNALKGNDSITIKSGSLILISTSYDGIKTENSGVSDKGNQKGTITIEGGSVDIYSAQDGISAAYDVEIKTGEDGEPTVNVFTSTYAGSASQGSSTEKYLIIATSNYSKNSDYYAYLYNTSGDGVYAKCTYETTVRSGRTSYYGLVFKALSGYANIAFCSVAAGTTPDASNLLLTSDGQALNTEMNGFLVTSSSTLDGEWVQLSTGGNDGKSGSGKTTYSSKGIKAANSITVSGGAVTIKAMDDGIHAHADGTLENGSKSLGDITISGGTVTIDAADDGMHADGTLTISGGFVNIQTSYEGLEANVINIEGGESYVYGRDDGMNACKGTAKTPMINITGGYIEVTTPSGDTDAVDSNGSFAMSGGVAIIKGGSSSGMVAGSVDVDGTITVTGGTIIAFGGICETPGSGSVNTYVSSGTSFSAGTYTLAEKNGETILSFKLDSSYQSVWVASGSISLGMSYVLSNGSSDVLSWTQSKQSEGSSGSGGGGGFRPGGRW